MAGLSLKIRLTPRAGVDRIDGIKTLADGEEVVAARVRAVPEKGAANRALLALLAESLGRPKSALAIVKGETGRLKVVRVEGETVELARTVRAWPRLPGVVRRNSSDGD